MVTKSPYKMSYSTGGLFVNESVEVARLHAGCGDWKKTIAAAMADGATSLPKAASNRRSLREIVNRLSCLTNDERQFLIDEADRPEQEALLWLATCRAYQFVREFAIEVIQERFLTYRPDLPLDASIVFSKARRSGSQSCSISARAPSVSCAKFFSALCANRA